MIKNMQIRTTVRQHLTPRRVTAAAKPEQETAGTGRDSHPRAQLVGTERGTATLESSTRLLKRVREEQTM